MNDQQFEIIVDLLARILDQLETISSSHEIKAPQLCKPLKEFKNFDWQSIGAKILQSDRFGAAVVEWRSREYIRRSPENKFGTAIFFSRSIGIDQNTGKNSYERLITFKEIANAEPISRKAESKL